MPHYCKQHAYTPAANSGFSFCPFCEEPAAFTKSELVSREVIAERERQEELKAAGKISFNVAAPTASNCPKLSVLAEEFGEVAHQVTDLLENNGRGSVAELRKELIQLAAVSVAWIESLTPAYEMGYDVATPETPAVSNSGKAD